MIKQRALTVSNIILALLATLFIVSMAVVLTLNFRQLYYFDIKHLNIPASSGYSAQEIRQNYDALISYNSVFFTGALNFPTMSMSQNGEIHFEEVKDIFVMIQLMFMGLALPVILGFVVKLKNKNYAVLKLTALFSVALPLVLGALIALNWNSFFVLFHKLFFDNDYWIFDAATDPVITILPDVFFMHCALMILGLVMLCAVLLFISYKYLSKRRASKT